MSCADELYIDSNIDINIVFVDITGILSASATFTLATDPTITITLPVDLVGSAIRVAKGDIMKEGLYKITVLAQDASGIERRLIPCPASVRFSA